MNPAARVLIPFLNRLRDWEPTICRSAYIQSLSIDLVDTGLQVTASWNGREWKKVFTNEEFLGHTSSLPAPSWKVPRRPCFWARQIIQEVLNQRGVR
jgi:hypothetical protein